MNVVILSPGMEHDGNTLKARSLGGSETAAIQLAEAIAAKKDPFGEQNRVLVFSPCPAPMTAKGVQYLPIGHAQDYCTSADIDLLIVSRAWSFLTNVTMNAKATFFWTHDLGSMQEAQGVRNVMWQVDAILALTEFHRDVWADNYGIPKEAFRVIRNGVDLALFPQQRPALSAREKGLMVMSGRPERGWDNLLKPGGIMERLAAKGCPATLHLTFYDNPNAAFKEQYDFLFKRAAELPNVVVAGPQTKEQLYDLYSRAWLYAYPSNWEETSCISAMEVAACGLPIFTTDVGGLKETVKPGVGMKFPAPAHKEWTPGPFRDLDEAYIARFVEEVENLYGDDLRWERMSRAAFEAGRGFGWEGVAQDVIGLAHEALLSKTANPVALYKHFFRLSDVEECNALVRDHGLDPDFLAGTEKERAYLGENYGFEEKEGTYREQYEKVAEHLGEGAYQGAEHDPRTQVTMDYLRRRRAEGKPLRILDYGCAHGHQTIRAANLDPAWQVVGVDISKNQIKWSRQEQEKYAEHPNLTFFHVDDEEWAGSSHAGEFDIVLFNEVLEHVPNPEEMLRQVEKYAKVGGTMFITVPYGAWEFMSYYSFPHRCHIRHYDMADLIEIFRGKPKMECFYRKAMQTEFGEPLGHHYVTYEVDGRGQFGAVNRERKRRYQAPRQTLSVCMIAKDAESMLHRTLKSVRGLMDELIVVVDKRTKDSTRDIVASYGGRVIEGESPLDIGFDEARNKSIAGALGQWILWIDADEELLHPERMAKYLRPNLLGGYAIQQHHLSVDPPMNMKPDLPVRLFRNHLGVRFFGVCHEHPEKALNEGIGHAMVIGDSWIAHDGYLTESVRRNRFIRNIDLVVRDRQKYPDRNLGYFLWLRDLIHLCRYEMEKNGGRMNPRVIGWAQEAVALFEGRFLSRMDDPMTPEAIGYYSEANRLLGRGVPMKFDLRVGDLNAPPKEIMAQFSSAAVAADFVGRLTALVLKPFESKYL